MKVIIASFTTPKITIKFFERSGEYFCQTIAGSRTGASTVFDTRKLAYAMFCYLVKEYLEDYMSDED